MERSSSAELRPEEARLMGVFVGVLALLGGAFCLYAPRSSWARERYEAKYDDKETAAKKQAEYVRMFTYIGIAWFIMGFLYLVTG